MSALTRVVRGGVGRRRVQTFVIGLVTLMAVATSVLAGSLLVASSAPFDDAFARLNGAHLAVLIDGNAVTAAEIDESADAEGVSATAGPFPTMTAAATASVPPSDGARGSERTTMSIPQLTIVGRVDRTAGVDNLELTSGTWGTRPGEIVLAASRPEPVGTILTFPDAPGDPELTVVGKAHSATRTADAWVAPSLIDALTTPGTRAGFQMLYRFSTADTPSAMATAEDAVSAVVGADALIGSQSWLAVRADVTKETALFVPFLVAFGALGVVMSVLIVGNVVASAVGSGTRRIGIVKSLGFTPAQVVRSYVAQALVPACVGAVLGVVTGNVLAAPVLSQTEIAYGTSGLTVAPWVSAVAVTGVLAVVAATAVLVAWRAGRLRTVDALAIGRARTGGGGLRAGRWAARLPGPRPISLGLGRPFARPARAAAVAASVLFGSVAVTFTVGLSASLSQVLTATANDSADVAVRPAVSQPRAGAADEPPGDPEGSPKSGPDGPALDYDTAVALIESQTGTARHYGLADTQASVSGMSGSVAVEAFQGDGAWGGYEMISGRWFDTAREAVVPTPFLAATGAEVGDTVTLHHRSGSVPVRIVGEVFDTTNDGRTVFTDVATFTGTEPIRALYIDVADGVDVAAYIESLNTRLAPAGMMAEPGEEEQTSTVTTTLNALSGLLTAMLVTVAVLGVLNTVLLDTRERVHEIGVHKALGMSPRQTLASVVASAVVPGLVGAAVGVPLGLTLHALVVPAMGDGAGLTLPDVVTDVYGLVMVVGLGVVGVLLAIGGSLLPAGWAARARTAAALRTE